MKEEKLKITLPIYYTQVFKKSKPKKFLVGLNWYRNTHYSLSNVVKHYYHDLVRSLIKNIKFNRIYVEYKVYAGRNGTDGHNIRAVIEKFFMDGLVAANAIEDDDISHVVGDNSEYFIDQENPRIEITVYEK